MKNIVIAIMSMAPISLLYSQITMHKENLLLYEAANKIQNRLEQDKILKYIKCYIYDRNGKNFDKISYIYFYDNFFVKKCISLSGDASSTLMIVTDTIFQNEKIKNIDGFMDNFGNIPRGGCIHPPPKYLRAQKDVFYIAPHMPPGIKLTRYSLFEWEVWVCKLDAGNGLYERDFVFKHRLFNFKCMNFFKNIKARKKVNRFIKDIDL